MIPIYKPYLDKYKSSAISSINDNWISNHGIYIDLASEKLKSILNVKYCILTNNGTSATHCLFKALKFKYPLINKIYVPNNVFISPINCALLEYNISQIEIMKLDYKTLNIDTSSDYIKSLDKNSAILIVHNLGSIVNVPRLKSIRPDIIFIEDNCEGFLGKYNDIYSGSSNDSLCSSVSFYGNKTITTGEGGAFFTNDIDVYKFIKTFHSHGMSEDKYIHNILGTNYRMTNVQAALLYDQLNDINHIMNLKNNIIQNYLHIFSDLIKNNIILTIHTDYNTSKSNWMFIIIINYNIFNHFNYNHFEKFMNEKNIQIRPIFYDLLIHAHLSNLKHHIIDDHSIQFSKLISNYGIMLPSYPSLDIKQQYYIFESFKEYFIINQNLDLSLKNNST